MAQPGPLARSVADLTLTFRIMANHVEAHPTGSCPPLSFGSPDGVDVRHLRVALLPQIGDWAPSRPVGRALEEAADALQAQGATVEAWTPAKDTQEGIDLFYGIVGADGFSRVKQILAGERPVPLMEPNVRMTSMPNVMVPIVAGIMGAHWQASPGQYAPQCKAESGIAGCRTGCRSALARGHRARGHGHA